MGFIWRYNNLEKWQMQMDGATVLQIIQ
jgi:hypothetical protein